MSFNDEIFNDDFLNEDEVFEPAGQYADNDEALNTTGGINTSGGTAMESTYDEYKRLYLGVDISGSMNGTMLKNLATLVAKPTMEDVQTVRAAYEAMTSEKSHRMLRPTGVAGVDQKIPAFLKEYGTATDNEILKALKADLQVASVVGVNLENTDTTGDYRTKLQTLKSLAKSAVSKRFAKYPDSSLFIAPFRYDTAIHSAGNLEQGLKLVDHLSASGGTSIRNFFHKILANTKKAKSAVNLHHVILVTDGECMSICGAEADLIRDLKEKGVVVDVVSIYSDLEIVSGGSYLSEMTSMGKESLRRIAEETGGTYTVALTAEEFEAKYLAATSRLLLPAGN